MSQFQDNLGNKVVAFGTFDLFHPGHAFFLEQAKALGDYLAVVIARDNTVGEVKGRHPVQNEIERLSSVLSQPNVDEALLGDAQPTSYKLLQELQFDTLAIGYDQKPDDSAIKKTLAGYNKSDVKVLRIEALKPDIYKSSYIRDNMQA